MTRALINYVPAINKKQSVAFAMNFILSIILTIITTFITMESNTTLISTMILDKLVALGKMVDEEGQKWDVALEQQEKYHKSFNLTGEQDHDDEIYARLGEEALRKLQAHDDNVEEKWEDFMFQVRKTADYIRDVIAPLVDKTSPFEPLERENACDFASPTNSSDENEDEVLYDD